MRAVLSFVSVALVATLASITPASAKWSCSGPAYVCGSAQAATKTAHAKSVSHKHTTKTAYKTRKARRTASSAAASKPHIASNSSTSYSGQASYYWQPQRVASGGWFNPNALTAAHKTLPFGTRVRVTNRHNGRSVVVTINDRGPYVRGRIIDLSRAAAHEINMQGTGVVPVSLTVLGRS
jgi:rare lipoprotein A